MTIMTTTTGLLSLATTITMMMTRTRMRLNIYNTRIRKRAHIIKFGDSLRRHESGTHTKPFARCRLCIKPAFLRSVFIGVSDTTNMRNRLIRKHKNEYVVYVMTGKKVLHY